MCSIDLIGLARRGGIKQNRTAHKIFRKKEINIMKGKKLLAGVLSAAMVLGTMAFPVFADGENWADHVNTDWYIDAESEYTLSTAEDLAGLASLVNAGTSFAKKTIKLGNDIDLEGREWTPIGKTKLSFQGTFDGNGNTVKNLLITGSNSDVGLFGLTTNGEIKNFTLENASVSGYLDVGAVAGTPYTSKYTNITVKGLIKIDGFAYVGGAFGKNAYANLTNVDVIGDNGSYVTADSKGYRTYVGGLVGFMGEGNQVISDCDVAVDVTGSTCDIGGISGNLHYGNKMINCTYRGSLALTKPTDTTDMTEIGGLVGTYLTNSGCVTSIEGCSADIESVMLTDLNGTTRDIKDEITSTGAAWKGQENAGEHNVTATINGREEKFTNNVANIGNVKYFSLKSAVAAAQAGDTITLCSDVTTTEQILFAKNVTLDLNGYTLTSAYVLTGSGNARYAVAFDDGGKIIDSSAEGEKGALIVNNARAVTSNNKAITIEGATIKVTSGMQSGNAVIGTTAGLIMKNSTIIGEFDGSYAVSSFGTTGTEEYDIENSVIMAKTVGIYRNGSAGKFKMTVKDSKITVASADENLAVYISNNNSNNDTNHEVSFENCEISGKTGIEAKYSNITLTNCKVTATGTPSYEQNNNGATASGFAVVITDNATGEAKAKPVGKITIISGDYTGMIGLENCADAKAHMDADTQTDAEISGGSFSTNVNAYTTDGYIAVESNGIYTVKKSDIQVNNTAQAVSTTVTLNGLEENLKTNHSDEFKHGEQAIFKTVIDAPSADDQTKAATVEKAENAKREMYDIKVVKFVGGVAKAEIPVTNQEVTLTLGTSIKDGEKIKVTHIDGNGAAQEISDVKADGNKVTFTAPSFSTYVVDVVPGTVTDIAENIDVKFENMVVDGKTATFDLVIEGADDKTINRFSSSEWEFNVTEGFVYSIEPAPFVNITVPADEVNGVYGLNMNGKTYSDATGKKIKLATVMVTGSGIFEFNAKSAKLHAAKIADNIVTDFDSEATTENGKVNIPADPAKAELTTKKYDLTVNIAFNNAVENNEKAYQDMTVTVSGGDLTDALTYELGSDNTDVAYNNGYNFTVSGKLSENNTYTVKVEGAGYRTARYTVTMTGDKTLNFWNNAKDTPTFIEEGKGTAKETNFLAGDIVKDGKINIYDLSAVVSYFGTNNLVSAHPEYAKYDLNRDGKIDSKDVAYVLVSWGK